jgi:hypothetical protein
MSTKDNEVNRNIDTETAEGHRVRDKVMFGEAEDAGKRASIRHSDALDDEAEGHRTIKRYPVEEGAPTVGSVPLRRVSGQ